MNNGPPSRLPPGPASILRCVQKDEEYQKLLSTQVHDVCQRIFGLRKWMKLRKELDLLSNLTYFTVTTLAGLQTLGEEYVDIVQIQGNQLRVPSILRRILMIGLQTSAPFILEKTVACLTKLVEDTDSKLWPDALNQIRRRHLLLDILSNYQQILSFVNRCHLVAFYFCGTYYHISKRLFNVNYTSIYAWMDDRRSEWLYKLLGYFTLIQLVSSLLLQYYSRTITTEKIASTSIEMKSEEGSVVPAEKCSLCLNRRKDSTCTPCGHLFCWYCICEWIQIKGECPLCRESVKPFQLIYLQNYHS